MPLGNQSNLPMSKNQMRYPTSPKSASYLNNNGIPQKKIRKNNYAWGGAKQNQYNVEA